MKSATLDPWNAFEVETASSWMQLQDVENNEGQASLGSHEICHLNHPFFFREIFIDNG
jgi:hypothetical protein